MSSLSFSCPKCDKTHAGIKPKMAGHKVRCQCGFVFRLGPKRAKQPGAVDDIVRKQQHKASLKLSDEAIDAIAIHSDDDLLDPSEVQPLAAIPVANDSQEEIFDGIPVTTYPAPAKPVVPVTPHLIQQIPVPVQPIPAQAIPVQPIPVQPIPAQAIPQPPRAYPGQQPPQRMPVRPHPSQPNQPFAGKQPGNTHAQPGQGPNGYYADNPLLDLPELPDNPYLKSRTPLPGTPAQKQKRMRRRNERHLDSNAGPIWTLILSVLGVPVMIFVSLVFADASLKLYRFLSVIDQGSIAGAGSIFGGTAGSSTPLGFVVTVVLCLVMLGTTIAMTISGVVAMVEITRGVHIGWASKIAAIFATVAIVGLFLMFSYRVIVVFQAVEAMSELGEKVGREVDTSQLGYAIGRMAGYFVSFAIVPLAVCVTGFARNMKR